MPFFPRKNLTMLVVALRKRVWIVDPIDGTAGFVKKDGDFAFRSGWRKTEGGPGRRTRSDFIKRVYYAVKGRRRRSRE